MKRSAGGTLTIEDVGKQVKLQAWVHRRREHAGVTFLNLRDRSGIVQVVLRPDEHPEAVRALASARIEWVVEVEGVVSARAQEMVNSDMATGAIEVLAEKARVLSQAEALPFTPDGKGDASEEQRLKYRYLELRRSELQENLRLRHKVTLEILKYFDERDFVHVETPILTRSTPEGARDYLVPSRIHRGEFYALPQSPQLFKQILMASGLERYVQIARCFRDEDLRADRQPEFTQVDVEMSFPDEEDIFELIEGLFARIFPLAGIQPELPFPRMKYAEAMLRFGSDRPDIRFDLEIADITNHLADSNFRAFRGTAADGGVIRAIRVPGGAGASRREVDAWSDKARTFGAAGVLTLKQRDGEKIFQVKGVLTEDEIDRVSETLEMGEGDMALIVAAEQRVAAAALGALRNEVAKQYDLIDHKRQAFLWVTDFPLVERDSDEKQWTSCNHPFTAPYAEDMRLLETDPGEVRARAYDVILNGVELGGGSIRIHEADLQSKVFELLGIGAEEAESRFGFLLEALRFGAPPHGGLALGLDRIIMLMSGADSLRDVIAFPKTTSATCLMTAAPSGVDAEQLRELGIELTAQTDVTIMGGQSTSGPDSE